MKTHRTPLLSLLVVALLIAGCDRSPVEPEPVDPEPTTSFTYSGDRSGSFQVRGTTMLPSSGELPYATWTAGLRTENGTLAVAALRAGDTPMADAFVLALHRISTPGTYTITRNSECRLDTPTSCAVGTLNFGVDWFNRSVAPGASYMIEAGSVTVTSIDADRIRGTFVASTRPTSTGNATLSLTSGSFDVPIVRTEAARPASLGTLQLWPHGW